MGEGDKVDIDKMEAGRELDALIAEKVMGLKPCTFKEKGSISGMVTFWECECGNGSKGCYPINNSAIKHHNSALCPYSEKIWAAWEVVEKMMSIGWHHCVNWLAVEKTHHCCFSLTEAELLIPKNDDEPLTVFRHGYAETAPLAICKAALRAVSDQ